MPLTYPSAIASVAASLSSSDIDAITSPRAFDEDLHLGPLDLIGLMGGGDPLVAQYLLVVDALNFCFWPGERRGREGTGRDGRVTGGASNGVRGRDREGPNFCLPETSFFRTR